MNFDTTWNIEKYKSPFECEEHWELRKSFLVAHKDKYPEDQLVCLAQVFFNVELLGCKYPDETMALVAELSEGIADSFREKKQQKLQRTFVKASDAAGAKLKGLPTVATNTASELTTKPRCTVKSDVQLTSVVKPNTGVNETDTTTDKPKDYISASVINLCNATPLNALFKDFIIWRTLEENISDHAVSILHRSMSKKNINPQFTYHMEGTTKKPRWRCTITIQNQYVANAVATSKQVSRKAVSEVLLNSLEEICFTVVEKAKILSDGSKIDKNLDLPAEEPKVSESSVASKMMKMMGWKGGGLGKTEQGRSEPVTVQDRVHRSGLGANLTQPELMKKLNNKLKAYAASQSNYDLVFSNDFSKDERAKLHSIAQKFHLKTRSYGTGNNRYLVVSKRVTNQQSIVDTLLSCGGENDRHILIPPSNFEVMSY